MGADPINASNLATLLMVRIACAGAHGVGRTQLRRDLWALVAHRLSPAEWREQADHELDKLLADGAATPVHKRLAATAAGRSAAAEFIGARIGTGTTWSEVRNTHLVARALRMRNPGQVPRPRDLATAAGLRAAILLAAYAMPAKTSTTAAGLRKALAARAASAPGQRSEAVLGRAAERATAARQLIGRHTVSNDTELVARIAAEQVGSAGSAVAELRLALLRRLLSAPTGTRAAESPPAVAAPDAAVRPAVRSAESAAPSTPRPVDHAEFAREVNAVARAHAEGWPGNRKAFISRVWGAIREANPGCGLSESEFKSRLTDAHRAGLLVLANADLRDGSKRAEVEASATRYKNTEWHYIRVEE